MGLHTDKTSFSFLPLLSLEPIIKQPWLHKAALITSISLQNSLQLKPNVTYVYVVHVDSNSQIQCRQGTNYVRRNSLCHTDWNHPRLKLMYTPASRAAPNTTMPAYTNWLCRRNTTRFLTAMKVHMAHTLSPYRTNCVVHP